MESKLREKLKELKSELDDYRYYGISPREIGVVLCKAKIELLEGLLND